MVAKRILKIVLILAAVILIGTLIYHNVEGWRYIDSMYFTVVTVTTIGYGDFTPKTDLGKVFTMFFAVTGISVAFYVISLFMRYIYIMDNKRRKGGNRGVIKIRR